ncbi:MAG: restriction endonuclease subunit S [Bacteroidales bacterium]|nr:restriction endonuclease subunit S [Bacteroidales bacterium]
MINFKDVKWGHFSIGDILEISPCKFTGIGNSENGIIPYVGATNRNNGVLDFINVDDSDTEEGNCIVFICNGQGSIGYSIYRETPFVGSVDVKVGRSPFMNRYIGSFITTAADKNRSRYCFGYKRTLPRLKKEVVRLPVAPSGQPDYAFMEEYMKSIENRLINSYFKQLLRQWPTYPDEIPSDISWGAFPIGDLFDVKRPNARNKDDYSEGNVPFVASGAENNGVMKCCSPKRGESLDKGNCITVSPVDGSCFYQPADFLGRGGAGSSILLLYHKDKILNKYSGLYISRMIEQVTTKYSYGHMATSSSIKKDRIFLPVTNLGNPDYAYMEAYVRKMEADLVMKYMDYQQNKK